MRQVKIVFLRNETNEKHKFRRCGAEPHNSAVLSIVHIKKYIDATVWYHTIGKRS